MTQRTLTYGRARLDGAASGDGPLLFTISSEVVNRHGFSLRHDGWRLENFAANPVLIWMHDPFRPPIGRAKRLQSE
jgi:hypothetical protein